VRGEIDSCRSEIGPLVTSLDVLEKRGLGERISDGGLITRVNRGASDMKLSCVGV
jgi:hypothetical protein